MISNSEFYCPTCKISLENKNGELYCNNCKEFFSNKNGYLDFLKTRNFVNDPILKSELSDVKSADAIFHGIGKNNFRCLEIGSNLGKVTENLSHIFHQVYSIETSKEKIEFQKKRFDDLGLTNITLLRCNPLKLPFPDNYFDLIVCNGILELCKIFDSDSNSKESQISFLKEMKRVLAEKGCLCLGVQNKFGLPQLFGTTKINNVKEKIKLISTHSLSGYHKLLKEVNFYSKAYWVLPSYKKPYFSGDLDDQITLQWFFQNITKFLLKDKRSIFKNWVFTIIKKFNKFTLKFITKTFVPSFIFCCYKSNNIESIEDIIFQQTKMNNFLTVGRRTRIINILLNKKGSPKKLISLERYGYKIPEKIIECKRIFPNMKNPENRMWMEDWSEGELLDPSKIDELSLGLNWLLKFQKDTKSDVMTKKFVQETETDWIKVGLSEIEIINSAPWENWLEEFESYVDKNSINKVAIHGDFWYSNILIDQDAFKIKLVLDWENFQKEGNPFFDIIIFIFQFMIMDSSDKVNEFKSNFIKIEKMNVIKKWNEKLSDHFGFEFKLIVLLRWFLMREIAYSKLFVNSERVNSYAKMLEFLSDKK